MNTSPKKIIVVGGGFAGLNFIKRMANDMRFQITLVDNNNYHFFPPLLYQVGMAFIEPSNISYPFRKMFQKKKNLRFHLGCLIRVNWEDKTIETETDILAYDYLVLALGTETNYFGMENVKKNSWALKSINDATNLRNHLLLNMEKAVKTVELAERKKLLNIVIAGGGPAGQVDAAKLAISKSISAMNEELRSTLKKAGLLKRDSREKERKKYGLRSARKREQFSKR